MLYKNMPLLQILLNLPFLILGFGTKLVFFATKKYGREYAAGIKNGFSCARKKKKYRFPGNICQITQRSSCNYGSM